MGKHGRAVHSFVKLLACSSGEFLDRKLVLRYCSPKGVEIPKEVTDYVEGIGKRYKVVQETYEHLEEAVKNANVLYVTRIQKERFDEEKEWEGIKGSYVV